MDENYEVEIENLMEERVGLIRSRNFGGDDLIHLLTVNIHANAARNNKKLATAREPRACAPTTSYTAIRAIGVEHAILSSDAGEPLFPDSVECMHLMRGYMRGFGLNEAELYRVTVTDPQAIVAMN